MTALANLPSELDWSFEEIRSTDAIRAEALARCGPPEDLILAVIKGLEHAVDQGTARFGFDGIRDDLSAPRLTVQFSVEPRVYDWFFSSRTGYRAHYWISPASGEKFNAQLVDQAREALKRTMRSQRVAGRHVYTQPHEGPRIDTDEGPYEATLDTAIASLDPAHAKFWVCERLLQNQEGQLKSLDMGDNLAKLKVRNWAESGVKAPYCEDYAWLDLKGGYVQRDGTAGHPKKSQRQRSINLNRYGWT